MTPHFLEIHPEEMSNVEWDASCVYTYLAWRTSDAYRPDDDPGLEASAADETRSCYENDAALALVQPYLADLGLTMREALALLIEVTRRR